MEQLDISLNKGVRRTPSFAENGELSECVGLYPKNGELRNIPVMTTLKDGTGANDFVLASGHQLLALHTTDNKKIYISRKANSGSTTTYTLYSNVWEDGVAQDEPIEIEGFTTDATAKVLTLGRIMMVLDHTGLHYFVWRNGCHVYLENGLPRLDINFSLKGEIEIGALAGEIDGHFDTSNIREESMSLWPLNDQHVQNITQQAYGVAASKTVEASRDGYFTHTFFVRYALRLYDQRNTMLSVPVRMTVSTNELFMEASNWHQSQTDIFYSFIKAKLEYYIKDGALDAFEDWKDIIEGVDIYVTAPIYTYKADGEKIGIQTVPGYNPFYDSFVNQVIKPNYGYTVSRLTNISSSWSGQRHPFSNNDYVKRDIPLTHAIAFLPSVAQSRMSGGWNAVLNLERRSSDTLYEDYKGEGPYYLLRSYDMDDLVTNTRTVVTFPSDRLENIVTQRVLQETETFDNIHTAADSLVYNRRLNLSDISMEVKCTQNLWSMVPHTTAWQDWYCDSEIDNTGRPIMGTTEGKAAYRMVVDMSPNDIPLIRVADKLMADEDVDIEKFNLRSSLTYLEYPSIDVDKILIYQKVIDGSSISYQGLELPSLSTGLLLNGTIYSGELLGSNPLSPITDTSVLVPTSDNIISYPDRILQSEAENPFVYKLQSEYNIGSGRIVRLATNTEPLSPGQYGYFPLVAFTTDGTYALEVKSDGTFSDPQPLSRDVLTNRDSVVYVDEGILFITNQGLKRLGINKEIRLLSGTLEGKNVDESIFVGPSTPIRPYVSAWASLFASDISEVRQGLQSCRIVYDGKNRLTHIFFEGIAKQAVLNMDGYEFASQVDGGGVPSAIVEDYVQSVMQFNSQNLYVYDSEPRQTKDYGFCLSRILSFGQAEQYANVMQMKVYHDADTITGASGSTPTNSMVKTALYVSNDKIHWALLTSLKGASYKYYRFALFTYMTDLDAVSGLSFLYNPARTNKLR